MTICPGKPVTGVISYGLWQSAFAGDRNIAGRETRLNGLPVTIIGVMPKDFRFPPGEIDSPDLWTPLQLDSASTVGRSSCSPVPKLVSGK